MKNIEEKRYWVWFSLIPNLGIKRKQKLLEIYGDPEKIYNLKYEELIKINGIGEKIIESILNNKIRKEVDKHLKYLEKNQIEIISYKDRKYPQKLREIYDYPISLYVKGNIEKLNEKGIAIVGCRDYSKYGENCAKYFGYNLAKNKINVISGLAKGIDSFSHFGALGANGNTIAVLGNGLDMIYPKENVKLANIIIKKGGAIISEYPLGTKPKKMNFPARNRIVSGMSDGVLVVEAKEKSGTLITVDFALEQGREVYVIPGNINSKNSVGTNRLIKEGAKVVTSFEDIIE